MKDQYVILTGSKNNAGDYLIKYRAKQLFEKIRPDRKIIDYNAWEEFDENKLSVVNKSKALILMGGPSLRYNMYPDIYKITQNLDDIKVPIISMGIGWKSLSGNWEDTYNYKFNDNTHKLLIRVNESGFLSSVRDYHSLNSLKFQGYKNFLMTGCPAYYDFDYIDKGVKIQEIEKVAFSLGVSFINSPSMEKLMKDNILACKKEFEKKEFTVVFHHSLDKRKHVSYYKKQPKHIKRHTEFAAWLERNDIPYIDISGSAENLINFYKNIDFHIGYRVHAHLFMNSISKFSILISEDGRAKGVYKVIGGIVLDGYFKAKDSIFQKLANRIIKNEIFKANFFLSKEILFNYKYEKKINYKRINNSRLQINNNFEVMKQFLKQLP